MLNPLSLLILYVAKITQNSMTVRCFNIVGKKTKESLWKKKSDYIEGLKFLQALHGEAKQWSG